MIVATSRIFKVIKIHSQKSLFKDELRKIVLSYWSFVIIALFWIVDYIIVYPMDYRNDSNQLSDVAYHDQMLTIVLPGIVFSTLPILNLYLIHFYSYSSVSRLFIVSTIQRYTRRADSPNSQNNGRLPGFVD